jgi:5'-deoxynucleotidase YfbR-like HD superfamily hydrolase
LLDYELWKYIYPKEIITNNLPEKLKEIIKNYESYSKLSINFVKQYDKNIILNNLNTILKL